MASQVRMNRFAALLDRLAYEHGRNAKLRQMTDYFRSTPDPDRGYALAALTGALSFQHAKPGIIRALIADRVDPVLLGLSYDYVGDLAETVALLWPMPSSQAQSAPSAHAQSAPSPLVGEGWGGGYAANSIREVHPPSCPSPTRGEGTQEASPRPCPSSSGEGGERSEPGVTRERTSSLPSPASGGGISEGPPSIEEADERVFAASGGGISEGPPSPLAGKGGSERSEEPGEGFASIDRANPSPGALARADLSHRGRGEEPRGAAPTLTDVVTTLASLGKAQLPARLARWLDALDETGRWALLKLVTGALRVGVSARLAKTAVAALGEHSPDEIELVWPTLAPPYAELFAWIEGRGERPTSGDPATFRPVMLAHAIAEGELAALEPADYIAEWKWDGIRIQAASGLRGDGKRVSRLFSRSGEDISKSFPDLCAALTFDAVLDGELLVVREGRVQSFNVLQQRLNRKAVTDKMLAEFPAHLRAYDLLGVGDEDLRALPFAGRRARLERLIAEARSPRIDLSPVVPFAAWPQLIAARADPAAAGAGADADAVEGVMLKRRDAPYLPGRPKGQWWKWKRDPFTLDAVLMYAQRGSGKRSSFYSDYTFGLWTDGDAEDELVPVGKAYFGFTDEELIEIDRFVRRNTVNRFGPVREVVHEPARGLVLEVAFEGLQRSSRHRSGVAMRFPRISRLRWDKPPGEADRLETLEKLLPKDPEITVRGRAR